MRIGRARRSAACRLLAIGTILMNVSASAATQYIVLNTNGQTPFEELFERVGTQFNAPSTNEVRVGVAAIFSYLNQPGETSAENLRRFLRLSEQTDVPVVVQLDGESWWDARPDLWNWWDPDRPGFDPANRANVEWTGWSPDQAIKIAWRNWGRQIRVLPPPNLMSSRYRDACREAMDALVPIILDWWRALPPSKRDLLVGIKVGWESSIGVNAWYYPNGNDLLDKPAADDPSYGLNHKELPSRGVTTIGYAAVSSAGLRHAGELTEADLAEIARRHLDGLCREMARLGVPREKLFTHTAGWNEGELLYQAAINPHSCPGWSFYKYASAPDKDVGVQEGLKKSDAPFWAAVEWMFMGPSKYEPWRTALEATLTQARCRYLCIYNWESIRDKEEILKAIADTAKQPP